jgi:predicted MFS family arabinose efflux permease
MNAIAPAQASARPRHAAAKFTLLMLLAIYVVNLIDRQILSILMDPIKKDLHLTDSQLGMLSGFSFAVFYALCGLPIARAADRLSRRNIVGFSLALWSVFTSCCGLAQGFGQLVLLRVGVAVGEAGSGPPSHSMIADLFPQGQRSAALAIYACGVPIGVLIGLAVGGWLNELFNWRIAFFVVGVPGALLALIFVATVREPSREGSAVAVPAAPESTVQVLRTLWRIDSLRQLVVAAALHSFSGYGLLAWNPTFLIRTYGIATGQVGLLLGLTFGLAGGIGTFLGGYLGDLLGRRQPRWYAWLPAIANMTSVPFYVGVFFAPTFHTALLFMVIPALMSNVFAGPVFGAVQSLAPPRMRATAAALLLFVFSLVGQGGGPLAIGLLSDRLRPLAGQASLRWAMVTILLGFVVSTWRFVRAGRSLEKDLALL